MSNLTATRRFEFRIFDENAENQITEYRDFAEKADAKRHAGKLAKVGGGPVDLAFEGAEDWNERYIVTAIPSEHHSAGFTFERLDA